MSVHFYTSKRQKRLWAYLQSDDNHSTWRKNPGRKFDDRHPAVVSNSVFLGVYTKLNHVRDEIGVVE